MTKRIVTVSVGALLILLILWILWGNRALTVSMYSVTSQKLPVSYDGFRVAHISDLHNAQMGQDNEKLLSVLSDAEPDMIAITGDLIDSRRTDMDTALDFVKEAVKIAPCYYVSGNHEARIDGFESFKASLNALGVTVLDNECISLKHLDEEISLIGVEDPSFQTDYLFGDSAAIMDQMLQSIVPDTNSFLLLLSHRPELYPVYVDHGIDLVLSGHAHGGQFRLPFVGGLYAPNQGFFPEYYAGQYSDGSTSMIVSRGIGNSILPIRINNRPEVIIIELHTEKTSD